jgi:hypothetical protein
MTMTRSRRILLPDGAEIPIEPVEHFPSDLATLLPDDLMAAGQDDATRVLGRCAEAREIRLLCRLLGKDEIAVEP